MLKRCINAKIRPVKITDGELIFHSRYHFSFVKVHMGVHFRWKNDKYSFYIWNILTKLGLMEAVTIISN